MVNSRRVDIKMNLHERRDPNTGAIITTLDEPVRAVHSNLYTACWMIGPNSVNPLAVLAEDEVFVVTFLHFEPAGTNGGGQPVLVEHGDGNPGVGHVVFEPSPSTTGVPPYKRTLGVGRPIIIATGPGNVEANEISGAGAVAGTMTWYIMKTTPLNTPTSP